MQAQEQLPGLDLDRFSPWFRATVPGVGSEPTASLIAGGKSNLTYEVSDGQQTWIVRRPPLGHVLATAHDMVREYRVMSALQDTDVPVPTTYALCRDESVLGAPFYVMERMAGTPYRRAEELAALGPERTRAISERLVDTLTALHAVEPASVGLADFGRPEGYLARQVARWKKQLDASYCRDLPAAEELHARLAADVPPESAAGIVHGDYRLDNVLVDADDQPTAVLDWEMADAGSAPGFLGEEEIIARYAAGSDRDLSRFGFYLGLAAYKLAAILEGIHYRHLHGQTVGTGFAGIGDAIHPLLDAGLSALKENH